METIQKAYERPWYIKKRVIIPGIFISLFTFFYQQADEQTQRANIEQLKKTEESFVPSQVIPGLAPVDVYLNMEKKGFETTKEFSSEYGNTWTSNKSVEGIDYRVTTFSENASNVESVKATAIIDPSIKTIVATREFIMYVASLPFEGSQPEKTGQWVKDNFNKDKSSTIVNGVKFTIYAPTKMARMLIVEKN